MYLIIFYYVNSLELEDGVSEDAGVVMYVGGGLEKSGQTVVAEEIQGGQLTKGYIAKEKRRIVCEKSEIKYFQ